MSTPTKLLVFAGSARRESFNTRLAAAAARIAAEQGMEVTHIDLRDYTMPLYNGDDEVEKGLPENTVKLQALFASHQAVIVATPEYNGLPTPLLKNTLDWVSRTNKASAEPSGLAVFQGKVAGLLSASPGPAGGLRSLNITRQFFSNLGMLVVPEQFALGAASSAFDEHGALKDAKQEQSVERVVRAVMRVTHALNSTI
jgi:chromate reductase, NAD(P)H dehydrogenase (quinone)